MPKFGIRVGPRLFGVIPSTQITVPTMPNSLTHEPVKRLYGLTEVHAWKRALAWTRAHGDPR
jgi:hypothetical protein